MLGAYGGTEFETPNIDAFARKSIRFDNHFAGSLPCMPARHDMLTGALDFLWRPWGSIEVWEHSITWYLSRIGVTSKLVTDHPHLFEAGGENYHTDFGAWDYQRGHESDPWRTRPDPSWIGAPSFGRGHMPYDNSRGWFEGEADFPGPRTMAEAARWIEEEAPGPQGKERYFLFIDEFDPHEPFDTPEPYASMYDNSWEGPHLIWPPYAVGAKEKGILSDEEARQIRASYGAKLTMIDHWFGRLIEAIEKKGLMDSTAVILCTDHGHYLGERDTWGKPACPLFEPIAHTPMMISWPGVEAGVRDALTTNVDIFATVAEIFGVTEKIAHRTHGKPLQDVITDPKAKIRDYALAGVWSREVHVIAGPGVLGSQGGTGSEAPTKYARGPESANMPLSIWSNRWSTMPIHQVPGLELPRPDGRASLKNMPGSEIPVICQPFEPGDVLPYWALGHFTGSHLYDLGNDPAEEHNLAGTKAESEAADLVRSALRDVEAPADQLARLGVA